MARTPFDFGIPDVQAEKPLERATDYEHIENVPPGAFGAFGAAALERGSRALEEGSNELGQTALRVQDFQNKAVVQQALNDAMTKAEDSLYKVSDDPAQKGYLTLTGADAMKGYQGAVDGLRNTFASARASLQNNAQRVAFDESARRYQNYYVTDAGRWADQQSKEFYHGQAQATTEQGIANMATSYNDPVKIETNLDWTRQGVLSTLSLAGKANDPVQVDVAMRKAEGAAAVQIIETMAERDPTAALEFAQNGKLPGRMLSKDPATGAITRGASISVNSLLDADAKEQLITRLQNLSDTRAAKGFATDFLAGHGIGSAPAATPVGAAAVGAAWDRAIQRESGGQQLDIHGQPLTSKAGGVGISQALPGTAKDVAERHGFDYDEEALKYDKGYNHMLGRAYFGDLVKQYGGDLTLASAAYNAGPARVNEWIRTLGDPRTGNVSDAEFASNIPFPETRSYVNYVAQPGAGRTVGRGATPEAYMDEADLMEQARAAANRRFPNRPDLAREAANEVFETFQQTNTLQRQYQVANEQKRLDDANAAASDWVPQIINAPQSVDVGKMSADPRLKNNGEMSWRLNEMLRSSLNADKVSAAVSHQTAIGLLSGIRAGQGAPGRISDMNPIYQAYQDGKLSNSDFAFVQAQFKELQTPDGERLNDVESRLFQAVRQSIDKSNPVMGILDMTGGSEFFRYQQDVAGRVAAYRAQGKNPFDLFDPSKPDYIASPASLAPYQKSLVQSVNDFATQTRQQAQQQPAPTAPAANRPPLSSFFGGKPGGPVSSPAAAGATGQPSIAPDGTVLQPNGQPTLGPDKKPLKLTPPPGSIGIPGTLITIP